MLILYDESSSPGADDPPERINYLIPLEAGLSN